MNRVDFTFDEYQANVLRTANRTLDWNQTVENCLYGLIGELGEIIESLNPQNNNILTHFIDIGKAVELVKKYKYHGKPIDYQNMSEEVAQWYMLFAETDTTFNVKETSNLKKELGDQQYYHTWLSDTLGFDASEIAQANVEKLRKRYGDGFSIEASLNRKD